MFAGKVSKKTCIFIQSRETARTLKKTLLDWSRAFPRCRETIPTKLICSIYPAAKQSDTERIYGVVVKGRNERESMRLFLSDERRDIERNARNRIDVCLPAASEIYGIDLVDPYV